MGKDARQRTANRIEKRAAEARAGVGNITKENSQLKAQVRKLTESNTRLERDLDVARKALDSVTAEYFLDTQKKNHTIDALDTNLNTAFANVMRLELLVEGAQGVKIAKLAYERALFEHERELTKASEDTGSFTGA